MANPDKHRRDFAEFALARAAALQRAAYLMVGDAALAQDLVQEALTKTYLAWPRLRDPNRAESYCRKAITTTALSWFRRKSWAAERPRDDVPERARTGGEIERETERLWLWQEIQRLPARQRVAVVLRFYEDLTEAQTAEVMGCAVGTVKSQVSAALKNLRNQCADADVRASLNDLAVL